MKPAIIYVRVSFKEQKQEEWDKYKPKSFKQLAEAFK